jgi:hypothetical protein
VADFKLPDLGSQFKSTVNKATTTVGKLTSGLPLDFADGSPKVGSISPPWSFEKTDSFFPPIDIDGERWNKLYPYRLLVVKANQDGRYEVVSRDGVVSYDLKENDKNAKGGTGFKISFQEVGDKWELQLPITPQQLQISTQYAINTSATQKGIVEEHAGVRFKNIQCSGTMGVWPHRTSLGVKLTSPSVLETLFSGTLNQVTNLVGEVNRFVNTITSNHPASKPSAASPEASPFGYQGTGYVYAMLWDQFLEQYAEAKKNPANADWRLVFDIPKQNQSFLVTPVQFSWNQTADSPNEIKYSFQLKAWKRIDLRHTIDAAIFDDGGTLTPNVLQKILTSIENARRVVGAASNVVKAVRSDFQTPFNAFRQLSLVVKDLMGIPASVIDLPRQIVSDYRSTVVGAIHQLEQDIPETFRQTETNWKAFQNIMKSKRSNEGLSGDQIASGNIGSNAVFKQSLDPANEPFENPEKYFDLFNAVNTYSLATTPEQTLRISEVQSDPSLVTVDDILGYRQTILDLATQISNSFGAGDAFYSQVYEKPAPYERAQEMTIDEFEILQSLYELIQSIDILTATQEIDDGRIASAMEYVGGIANDNDIVFETSQSKIKVPVPYGTSMEEIAARYLKNPDRWIEIATLNALKSPYIDEVGFTRTLLSNASGRQLNIGSAENMYSGQKVTLQSNTQIPTVRKVIDIEKISDTNYLITLDGLDNLDNYTTLDNARVKAYLPGTVNSQNQIFIPSDQPPSNTTNTREVSAFSDDSLVGLSKIDWLIGEDGDVVLDPYGDMKLAAGLTNLVQALKLKFATPTGRLLKHPTFGSSLKPGLSTSEINATDLYKQIKSSVLEDKRFSSLEKLEVFLNGPVLTINMAVGYNNTQVLPISFSVNV